LQHSPTFIRVKYWQQGPKTAWILHEVGKSKPITVGIVIEKSKIQQLKVLTFRESRGGKLNTISLLNSLTILALMRNYNLAAPLMAFQERPYRLGRLKKWLELLFISNNNSRR